MNEFLAIIAVTTALNTQPVQYNDGRVYTHHEPHRIVHVDDRRIADTHRELSRVRYNIDTIRGQKKVDGRSTGMIYDILRGQR